MTSLAPVWIFDFIGNLAIMGISVYILLKIRRIIGLRPRTPIWVYLQWQVAALAVFALSHSVGHVAKRILVTMGYRGIWEGISPITGSINSVSFVVVGILSFLYKDVESASEKYGALQEAKKELEQSLSMLRESSIQMERDAEEILRKNRELSVLNKIALAVSKSIEMDKVLSAIIKEAKEFLGVEFLGIYLVEGDMLNLKVPEGMSPEFMAKVASRSTEEPWLKRSVLTGKPIFAREHLDEKVGKIDAALKTEGLQVWAAVPLMAKGRVVGVLTAGSKNYGGIEPGQMDVLATVGGYAGVLIENSSLYEELKQKVEDLERFRKFSVGREMRILELKEKLKGTDKKREG